MKKFLTVLLILLLVIVVAFGGLLGFLTVTEYRPADVESVTVRRVDGAGTAPIPSDGFSVLSWNIGYAGLGCTPPAIRPATWAMSTIRYAPTESAISRIRL